MVVLVLLSSSFRKSSMFGFGVGSCRKANPGAHFASVGYRAWRLVCVTAVLPLCVARAATHTHHFNIGGVLCLQGMLLLMATRHALLALPHANHEHVESDPARLTASGGGLQLLQIKRPVQPKRPGGQQLHRWVHTDEELPQR